MRAGFFFEVLGFVAIGVVLTGALWLVLFVYCVLFAH